MVKPQCPACHRQTWEYDRPEAKEQWSCSSCKWKTWVPRKTIAQLEHHTTQLEQLCQKREGQIDDLRDQLAEARATIEELMAGKRLWE